jgi:pheromone shutdown protein TraB
MITLLGTSHVSAHSKHAVEKAIAEHDIIAIELDAGRAHALLSGERATFAEMRAAVGLRAAVIASILRGFQERIAKSLGVVPGLEMKAALETAHALNKTAALIDRDVRITMQRFTKSIGLREIARMIADLFRPRKMMSVHPSGELVLTLLEEMRVRYPRIYRAMVSERDAYMARQLVAITRKWPEKRVLAVVGMGHVPGMSRHLEEAGVTFSVHAGKL